MNRYSISSDSDRWWYPTGIAATIGAAAVGAIFIVPAMGAPTAPGETPTEGSVLPRDSGSVTIIERPCYLTRTGWKTHGVWEQPVCTTEIHRDADVPAPGTYRVPPDSLP